MVKNSEIARILKEIAGYYAMKNEPFKPRAYEKAAEAISDLDQEASVILAQQGEKGLLAIPAVGKGIAEHIKELLKTGKLAIYEKLKKEIPVNLSELMQIEGIGPKTAQSLYKKFGIRNRKDLEKASKKHLVSEKITNALKIEDPKDKRYITGYQYGLVERLLKNLRESGLFEKIEVGGSFRRRQETIGDLDFLGVARKSKQAMDFFTRIPDSARVIEHGPAKSEIALPSGLQVDLRLVPEQSWGAAFIYFTGDLAHNIKLRKMAIDKGWKLSEYGLFQAKSVKSKTRSETEEQVYNKLGMDWIPPELRTDSGEIEAAQKHKLPKLIEYGDVIGDLQVQTDWSDGNSSIEKMAEQARMRGLQYIAITDHTKTLKIANGLDEKRLLKQMKEIDQINEKLKAKSVKFKVLKGAEVNILKDGTLDIEDSVLKKLDVVGVSIHSYMKMDRKDMTARIVRALSHPLVDIFFHPTTRLINRRPPIDFDFTQILKTAKKNKVAMEINAYPERTDLRDTMIRQTVAAGVKLTIDSDAHAPKHFDFIQFGEGQARRGWATKADVLNTKSAEDLLKHFK